MSRTALNRRERAGIVVLLSISSILLILGMRRSNSVSEDAEKIEVEPLYKQMIEHERQLPDTIMAPVGQQSSPYTKHHSKTTSKTIRKGGGKTGNESAKKPIAPRGTPSEPIPTISQP